MVDIIEKPVKASELPADLRGDIELDASVLVSVRRLSVNGFTKEFEDHILAAEKSGQTELLEAEDALKLLRKIADEDQP